MKQPSLWGRSQHQVVHLALHTGDDRHRLPEVTLGVAWWVGQGHEHLLRPTAVLPDVVLDRRVSAVEPVLTPQPLKDPLRRVALLPGDLAVSFQDGVNHPGEGLKLRLSGWFLPSVPWRYRVGQHLAHRVPVQTEHPGGFPNAHPLHHAGPANPRVHLHCKHPSHLPKTDTQPYERQRTVRFFRRHNSARGAAHVVHFTSAFYNELQRSETAPPVVKKIHNRGVQPDPLCGLFPASSSVNLGVVEYEPDPLIDDN